MSYAAHAIEIDHRHQSSGTIVSVSVHSRYTGTNSGDTEWAWWQLQFGRKIRQSTWVGSTHLRRNQDAVTVVNTVLNMTGHICYNEQFMTRFSKPGLVWELVAE